jgi:hypothetical protein
MALRAGELGDWAGPTASMAREIETALQNVIPLPAGEDPLPRRKLCVAIAKGVLKHLKDNQASITVQVPTSGQTTAKSVAIDAQL